MSLSCQDSGSLAMIMNLASEAPIDVVSGVLRKDNDRSACSDDSC
jgi:hypothetical protein